MKTKSTFQKWLDGDLDIMEHILDTAEVHDAPREELKHQEKMIDQLIENRPQARTVRLAEQKSFRLFYNTVAVVSAVVLIGVLLFAISRLPLYGHDNPRADVVVERYVEKGLEETGAVNIVAGMILDYRAFDTLGESHVLFTALVCVLILLRVDKKNMRPGYEEYYTLASDTYYDLSHDDILRYPATFLVPCIFIYGIYILLNGQNAPGGGFSGGAVMGAGMIILSSAFGFRTADRFYTQKMANILTVTALGFYSFAKGYVFITGANGIPNGIPKGTPGAILSGGMILPLDIAVGLVVAGTMYGFYSLFRRGRIGNDANTAD